MSKQENLQAEGHMLTAEYKDGQLQIVEVSPFEKDSETHILPDISTGEESQPKYFQVLDPNGKGVMHLDLLNFTLVKCSEGYENTYQMVGTSSDDGETLTCVLSNDDAEEGESSEGQSYVILEPVENSAQTYDVPIIEDTKRQPTPSEILERAKALQKANALLNSEYANRSTTRGRKRKGALAPLPKLLSSPNFKLYLYSCKLCSFKCNAVKEMSAHKAQEHGTGSKGAGTRNGTLQCARCPYRANVYTQLVKHINDMHCETETAEWQPDEAESEQVCEVLVCGACGFESEQRTVFAEHIHTAHKVSVTLPDDIMSLHDTTGTTSSR